MKMRRTRYAQSYKYTSSKRRERKINGDYQKLRALSLQTKTFERTSTKICIFLNILFLGYTTYKKIYLSFQINQ